MAASERECRRAALDNSCGVNAALTASHTAAFAPHAHRTVRHARAECRPSSSAICLSTCASSFGDPFSSVSMLSCMALNAESVSSKQPSRAVDTASFVRLRSNVSVAGFTAPGSTLVPSKWLETSKEVFACCTSSSAARKLSSTSSGGAPLVNSDSVTAAKDATDACSPAPFCAHFCPIACRAPDVIDLPSPFLSPSAPDQHGVPPFSETGEASKVCPSSSTYGRPATGQPQ
eukprot:2697834-Rhodomonas_salina.2